MEGLGVDGRTILEWIEIGINARNWVESAQDRDYWRALVNAAFNPISHEIGLVLEDPTNESPTY